MLEQSKKQRALTRLESGESEQAIASSEEISVRKLRRWQREIEVTGIKPSKLNVEITQRRYQIPAAKLSWIYFVLTNKSPSEFFPEKRLWNGNVLRRLIELWCGDVLDTARIYHILADFGFTFTNRLLTLRSSKRPDHRLWVQTNLEPFLAAARRKEARIYLIDQFDLTTQFQIVTDPSNAAYSYIVQQAPVRTPNRIIYALDLSKRGALFLSSNTGINAQSLFEFIDRLRFETGKETHVIIGKSCGVSLDTLRAHVSTLSYISVLSLPAGI